MGLGHRVQVQARPGTRSIGEFTLRWSVDYPQGNAHRRGSRRGLVDLCQNYL
jgi:hypothetical protein